MAAAYVFYFGLLLALSIWPELTPLGRLRYLAMLFVTIVPTMTAALWLELCWPQGQAGWAVVFFKAIAVLVIWAATSGVAWRAGGWHRV